MSSSPDAGADHVSTTNKSTRAPRGNISRQACDLCRKRKLKCDAASPSCSSCIRLGADCQYLMARGKSGPRKGHLKTLYDRIAHMEAIVVDADVNGEYGPSSTRSQGSQARAPTSFQGSAATGPALGLQHLSVQDPKISCEDIARLDEIFFRIVYPFVPIIHKDSFPLESGPDSRNKPLKGLRNAMWTLASVHDQNLSSLQDYFYRTARSSLQADELVSDEGVFTLEHCQAWLLVAYYEFRLLKNLKAWLSAGCAIRIAQALGFDRLDGDWSVQTQSPVLDATSLSITERETIRRTFWLLFWADRCGSLALSRSPAIAEYTVSQDYER